MLNDPQYEIIIDTNNPLLIKTNDRGVIEYLNDSFLKISGYNAEEIIGKDVSFFRHPDMPITVFNHIWANIFKKNETKIILKYINKTGEYFWLQLKITYKINENNEIENLYLRYQKTDQSKVMKIEKIYKTIKDIELHSNHKVAENYFDGILEENSQTINEFMEQFFI